MLPVGIVEIIVQHRQSVEEALAGCDAVSGLTPQRAQLITASMEVESDQIQSQQQV